MKPATQAIIDAIRSITTHPGEMAEMRDAESAYPGFGFRTLVLSAAREGAIAIHRHDHPSALTEEQRAGMLMIGDKVYNGISVRLT